MSDYPDEFIKWHNAKFDDISVSFSGHVIDRFEQWSEIKALQSRVAELEELVGMIAATETHSLNSIETGHSLYSFVCMAKTLSEVSDE